MARLTDNLDEIADRIRMSFTAKDAAREQVLPLCREVIRHSSNAIRALHRQQMKEARAMLRQARKLLDEADRVIAAAGEAIRTGFLMDAQKEYAEGSITLALVNSKKPPSPEELKVEYSAYLHGLAEAVGELRRYLLDSMRKGDVSRGEELLSAMDDIYNILVTIDYPDAITGGLRRATDMVRGILEKTRSDLTLTIQQKDLEERLRDYENRKEETE